MLYLHKLVIFQIASVSGLLSHTEIWICWQAGWFQRWCMWVVGGIDFPGKPLSGKRLRNPQGRQGTASPDRRVIVTTNNKTRWSCSEKQGCFSAYVHTHTHTKNYTVIIGSVEEGCECERSGFSPVAMFNLLYNFFRWEPKMDMELAVWAWYILVCG